MSYVVRQVGNSFYSTRYMRSLFSCARHRTPKGTPIDQLRENETWIENDLHSFISFSPIILLSTTHFSFERIKIEDEISCIKEYGENIMRRMA